MAHFSKILIVDDDCEIRDLLSQFLANHGYQTDTVADGQAMHQQLSHTAYDLIVLDLMLPGEDGLMVCRQLRATSTIPIIMLTAIAEDMDRIIGLEMGADDYVTKPFNPRELLARIKAVLRRNDYTYQPTSVEPLPPFTSSLQRVSLSETKRFQFENWVLDVGKRELRTYPSSYSHVPDAGADRGADDSTLVSLTAGEFDLLLAFVEHPQRVLSRDQLLDYTKGYGAVNFDRSIDVQLSRLRRKIEGNSREPSLIKTIRGEGYLFTPTVVRLSTPKNTPVPSPSGHPSTPSSTFSTSAFSTVPVPPLSDATIMSPPAHPNHSHQGRLLQ